VSVRWYINGVLAYALLGILFFRAFKFGLWKRYPLFFAYVVYTGFWSVIQGLPVVFQHPAYPKLFWTTHLGSAVLRFAVAAEVYRQVFSDNAHLRRTARAVLTVSVSLIVLLFWIMGPSPGASVILDFLRKISFVVAVWILVVLGLAAYYGLRIGRNVWGIALGLLIFMGSELVHLAAMDLFPRLRTPWGYVHPIAYVCMLAIWVWSLWNYAPNPSVQGMEAEASAQALSYWRDRFAVMNGLVRKVVKPWSNLS
jgi:hypothetical protein